MTRSPAEPADLGRRSLLVRGGALAAGVLGAGAATAVGAAPAAAASGAFTAVTPFRCYDSRVDGFGKLEFGEGIEVQAFTDAANAVKFPSSATAVTYNLTVTETESRGYVAMYPGSTVQATSLSTLNWSQPGIDLSNGGVVALGTTPSPRNVVGSVLIYLSGWTNVRTHVILDITGWYA